MLTTYRIQQLKMSNFSTLFSRILFIRNNTNKCTYSLFTDSKYNQMIWQRRATSLMYYTSDGTNRTYSNNNTSKNKSEQINDKKWTIVSEVPSAPKPDKEYKKYTEREVALHDKDDDCWIIIDGRFKQLLSIYNCLYDITEFIDLHPGGDLIYHGIGKDGTDLFVEARHSYEALHILNDYYIGDLIQEDSEDMNEVWE